MEGRKRCKITAAAATALKVPQCVALVFSAFDCWQIAIIVGDCPGCVVRLDRLGWPLMFLVSCAAVFAWKLYLSSQKNEGREQGPTGHLQIPPRMDSVCYVLEACHLMTAP